MKKRCIFILLVMVFSLLLVVGNVFALINRLHEGESVVFNDFGEDINLKLMIVSDFSGTAIFSMGEESSKALRKKGEHTFKNGYTVFVSEIYMDEAEDGQDLVEYYIYRDSAFPDSGFLSDENNSLQTSNVKQPLDKIDWDYVPRPTLRIEPTALGEHDYRAKIKRSMDYNPEEEVRAHTAFEKGVVIEQGYEDMSQTVAKEEGSIVQEKIVPQPITEEKQAGLQIKEVEHPKPTVVTKKPSVFSRIENWFKNLF